MINYIYSIPFRILSNCTFKRKIADLQVPFEHVLDVLHYLHINGTNASAHWSTPTGGFIFHNDQSSCLIASDLESTLKPSQSRYFQAEQLVYLQGDNLQTHYITFAAGNQYINRHKTAIRRLNDSRGIIRFDTRDPKLKTELIALLDEHRNV